MTHLPSLLTWSQNFYCASLQVSPLSWQWLPSALLPGSPSPRSPMSQQWISLYLSASSLSSLLWWSMALCIILSATGNQARTKTKRRKTLYVSCPIGTTEIFMQKDHRFVLVWSCLDYLQVKPQHWAPSWKMNVFVWLGHRDSLWSLVTRERPDSKEHSYSLHFMGNITISEKCMHFSSYSRSHWFSSFCHFATVF